MGGWCFYQSSVLIAAEPCFSNKTHVFEGSIVSLPQLACCIAVSIIIEVHIGISM